MAPVVKLHKRSVLLGTLPRTISPSNPMNSGLLKYSVTPKPLKGSRLRPTSVPVRFMALTPSIFGCTKQG